MHASIFALMGRTFEHFWEGVYHAAIERLVLFLFLFVVLLVWGWLNNRRFKTSERGSTMPWLLLLLAFALVLVLRTFGGDFVPSISIATALLVAGFVARAVKERDLWLPGILLASLMGMGFMLSALLVALVGALVLLFTARR